MRLESTVTLKGSIAFPLVVALPAPMPEKPYRNEKMYQDAHSAEFQVAFRFLLFNDCGFLS